MLDEICVPQLCCTKKWTKVVFGQKKWTNYFQATIFVDKNVVGQKKWTLICWTKKSLDKNTFGPKSVGRKFVGRKLWWTKICWTKICWTKKCWTKIVGRKQNPTNKNVHHHFLFNNNLLDKNCVGTQFCLDKNVFVQ